MRFDAYSVIVCGVASGRRCQAACTPHSRWSMSLSIYLCLGDIRHVARGPDSSKVASIMDNNSPFLIAFVVTIGHAY
jgi:hypothetical protein